MKPDVWTVITAAGKSDDLFLQSGFSVPKSLVKWQGKSVISRAIESYATDRAKTVVAANADECLSWPVEDEIRLEYPEVDVRKVPSLVRGALATAVIALDGVPTAAGLMVAAGDSQVDGGIQAIVEDWSRSEVDGGVIVFRSDMSRYSYARVSEDQTVSLVAEKSVVSDFATAGAFYFGRVDLFLEAAKWCFVNHTDLNGQFFCSSALNYLIMCGKTVVAREINSAKYRSFSLPADFSQ